MPSAKPVVPIVPVPVAAPASKPAKPARPKTTIDPQLIAKARELRDRYLEQVNDQLLLAPSGKYDVSRALESALREPESAVPQLPAA